MDIVTGSTTGRDALRAFLRASTTTATDADIQQAWDVAVDATYRYVRPAFRYDAPAGVVEFVLHVAAIVWRHRDTGGEGTVLPDGQVTAGAFLTQAKIKHLCAAYAGPYAVTPRVVAG